MPASCSVRTMCLNSATWIAARGVAGVGAKKPMLLYPQ